MNKLESLLSILVILLMTTISCNNDGDDEDNGEDTLLATTLELVSGENQETVAGEQLNNPIVVRVLDQFGAIMENAEVTWTVVEGTTSENRTVTNENGETSVIWTLGPSESQNLIAELSNIPASFIELSSTALLPLVTDIDGNQYSTIRYGNQIWISESLRTTKYSDGTSILRVDDASSWSNLSQSDKALSFNDEIFENDHRYGALYTWAAATNGQGYSSTNPSGIQGVCPSGWHIPSSEEYEQLRTSLGGEIEAGGAMKESGTSSWDSPNTGATNSSGFTGLPGGYRHMNGDYFQVGITANFWSTTENCNPCSPASWWLFYRESNFYHGGGTDITAGLSIRCVMDHE